MKKTLKIVSALFSLIVIAVLVFALTFDVNDYKQDIVSQVEQQTRRDFSIDGDLDISVFPIPRLIANNLALGNAPWASEKMMFSANQVDESNQSFCGFDLVS